MQIEELKYKFTEEKSKYEPEGEEKKYFDELNKIYDRLNDTYEECNKTRATVEFYSYAKPPDYIYRIGEVILEVTCQIPLRTPFETEASDATPESRDARWKQIRA